jgi:autotransporter-associated beta strand protein
MTFPVIHHILTKIFESNLPRILPRSNRSKPMKLRKICYITSATCAFALAPAASLLVSSTAFAGNTWDGGGTSVGGLWNWSDNSNWNSNTAPSYGTVLTFGGSTGLASNNDAATTSIAGITFSSGAGAFTLSGSSVTLGGNITNNSTSVQTVNLPLVLDANRTVTISTGDITLGGAISGGFNLVVSGGTARTATMNTAGSSYNRLQINSATTKLGVNNALPTTGGVTFASGVNGGTLDLNGKTQTLGSTIIFAGSTSTGTATIIDSAGGGLLKLGGDVTQNVNTGTPTVNISAALDLNGATRTFTVASTDTGLAGGLANGVITVSGAISNSSGTAGLTKAGVGALTLSGANSYNGNTTVSAGLLTLGNALTLQNSTLDTTNSIASSSATTGLKTTLNTLTLGGLSGNKNLASLFDSTNGYSGITALTLNPATGQTPSYSGVIADGATGMKLTKTGDGTQTLTGPNTYSGDTTVSAGTLTLGANDVIGNSSVVKLDGGTLNTANGVVESLHSIQATAGRLILGVSGTAGSADITLLNDSVIHNIEVGINGTLRLAAGKTLTQTATGTASQLVAGDTFTLDIGAGGFAHLSGAINSGGNDGAVAKTGSGTLRLTGATSQWGGATVIENGTLEFNTIADYNIVSSIGDGDNGGTNDAILRIGSTATAATLKMIGTEVKNSSNRAIQLGDAGGTIDVDNVAQTLTLSGTVSNATTAGALTKTGAGTLVLSGTSNTYTGATTVTTGTLVVDGSTAAGSAVSVASGGTLGGTGTIGGTLALTGKLAPGAAGVVDIETLNAGTTTWNGGSIWNFDLSSSDNTSDQLVITGDLIKGTGTLGTDYVFDFMGSQPVWNTTYTLATFASAIDFTSGLNFTATNLGAGSYSTSFFTLNSNSLTFTAVPEPTSSLAGLLLTAGLLRRRRR